MGSDALVGFTSVKEYARQKGINPPFSVYEKIVYPSIGDVVVGEPQPTPQKYSVKKAMRL